MTAPPRLFSRPDGRGVWIYPLTFGRARIVLGDEEGLDDGW